MCRDGSFAGGFPTSAGASSNPHPVSFARWMAFLSRSVTIVWLLPWTRKTSVPGGTRDGSITRCGFHPRGSGFPLRGSTPWRCRYSSSIRRSPAARFQQSTFRVQLATQYGPHGIGFLRCTSVMGSQCA